MSPRQSGPRYIPDQTTGAAVGPTPISNNDTPLGELSAMDEYPVYWGEPVIPRSVSPSPPQTQEITISGSARNTQFPILVGSARISGDLMGIRVTSSNMYLAYRLGEAPPAGLSSITNIKIDGTSCSTGSSTAATGVDWVSYCAVHLGAQDQAIDSLFDGLAFGSYDWTQRHQGTAWIAMVVTLATAPTFTSVPVVTCDFDAGSIDDWDSTSRSLSNPAVAAYYYMTSPRFGFDSAASSFNVTEWDAFADFCDTTIDSEARWSVNGALTGQSSRDVLELILKHGFGAIWYWGDEWHVGYMKTHSTASATATQADFAMTGGFRFTNISRRKLPNRVFAWFTDEENDRDDCRVAEATDISPSNCRETQIRLELCTSASMALRWAYSYLGVMKEESRVGSAIIHPGVAKNLAPYERLDITSDVGLTDSTWRVTSVKPRAGGFIEVDVRQYSGSALSTAYDTATPGIDIPEGLIQSELVRTGKFGDIVNGHTVNIDEDGHLTLSGDATVWEDFRVSASLASRLGYSDPGWVKIQDNGGGSTGVYGLGFSGSTDEEIFFTIQLPHEWKEGSEIHPHVHWVPDNNSLGSQGVTWGLEYTWANIGIIDGSGSSSVFGNTTIITADDAGTMTGKEHRVVNFDPITATGKTISSHIVCRLFRDVSDANDNYGSDAIFLEFDAHYEIDSLGSNTAATK